jgi:hypothetical protein
MLNSYLENVRVVQVDTMDTDSGWVFDTGRLTNSTIELIGLGGEDWSGFFRKETLLEGHGITINFKYNPGAVFECFFDDGGWFTNSYKRFGIYVDNNRIQPNMWAGRNKLPGSIVNGNFVPQPDTTYSLLMALLPDGGFLAVIWDPMDPSKVIFYQEDIGTNWSNLTWRFAIQANQGTILFDNFTIIEFDNP